jgi:death on curing protein
MKPVFLNTMAALRIHQQVIARDGGDPGLRDVGLLESALAQPMAMFGGEYLHRDLAEMAAVYLYHLAMNHAFVDGNKRVAAAAAGVFIDLNGGTLTCNEPEFEAVVLAVARGELDKEGVAGFLRKSIQPPEIIDLALER